MTSDKTENKNGQSQASGLAKIEELAIKMQLKAWVFAGVKAANHWAEGRVMTKADFEAAVNTWLKGPMHGGTKGKKG